jgi:hypothetical protein
LKLAFFNVAIPKPDDASEKYQYAVRVHDVHAVIKECRADVLCVSELRKCFYGHLVFGIHTAVELASMIQSETNMHLAELIQQDNSSFSFYRATFSKMPSVIPIMSFF